MSALLLWARSTLELIVADLVADDERVGERDEHAAGNKVEDGLQDVIVS